MLSVKRSRTIDTTDGDPTVIPFYDSNTWTPVLKVGSSTVTLVDSDGTWVRVGQLAFFTLYVEWSADISADANELTIDNMPFSADDSSGIIPVGAWDLMTFDFNGTPEQVSLTAGFGITRTVLGFEWVRGTATAGVVGLVGTDTKAVGTKFISMSGTYQVKAGE